MVLTYMTQQCDVHKFRFHLKEVGRELPLLLHNARQAIEIGHEIVEYIREKCAGCGWTDFAQIDEIARDHSIYASRVDYLHKTFQGILLHFGAAAAKIDEADGLQRMNVVFERFCDFMSIRRDFTHAFELSEQRWCAMENMILARLKGE